MVLPCSLRSVLLSAVQYDSSGFRDFAIFHSLGSSLPWFDVLIQGRYVHVYSAQRTSQTMQTYDSRPRTVRSSSQDLMAPGDVSDLVCVGRTKHITLIGVVHPCLHFAPMKQGSNSHSAAADAAATAVCCLSWLMVMRALEFECSC